MANNSRSLFLRTIKREVSFLIKNNTNAKEGNKLKKSWILSLIISQVLFVLFLPVVKQVFSYLHPIAITVVWACLTVVVILLVFLLRKDKILVSHTFIKALIWLYATCLLILLFWRPSNQSYSSWNLVPFSTILMYLRGAGGLFVAFYNIAANIGLFIPFGVYVLIKRERKWFLAAWLIILPLFFISLIEITQYIIHRGSMDIDDLILNFLGVLIGYALYPLIKKVLKLT